MKACQGYGAEHAGRDTAYTVFYFADQDGPTDAGGLWLCAECVEILNNSGAVIVRREAVTA